MFKRKVYYLVIFCLLIMIFVGCSGNPIIPPTPVPDIEVFQEKTDEEGVADISFEDNNREIINLQIKTSDSDTLELLENIDVDLVQNENGELVLFLTDPEGIYISKIVNLGLSKNYYREKGLEDLIPFYSIVEKLVNIHQALTSGVLDEYPPQKVDQSIFNFLFDKYYIYSGRFPLSELKYSWDTAMGSAGGALLGLVIKTGYKSVLIAIDVVDMADTFMRAEFVKKLQSKGYQDDDILELYYTTSLSDITNQGTYSIPTPYIIPMGDPGEFTQPVIKDIDYDNVVEEYEEIEIECFASDRDGRGSLEYYWSCNYNGEITYKQGKKITWQAPEYVTFMSDWSSLCYFTCEVKDQDGLSDKWKFTINVTDSTSTWELPSIFPEIVSLNPDPDTVGIHPSSAEITCNTQNQDGDDLRYEWSASAGYFSGDTNKSKVEWFAPDEPGIYTITCKVINIFGNSDTMPTDINVEEIPPPPATLEGLSVFPNIMSFSDIGIEKNIDSVELFWSDGNQTYIMEGQATYKSLNPSVAIFTGTGEIKIKSIGPGDTQIKVSYTDSNNVTKYNYIDVHVEVEEEPPPIPEKPTLYDPGSSVSSGTPYTVSWSDESASGATSYSLMEYTSKGTSRSVDIVSGTSKSFTHDVSTDTIYYYQVASWNDNTNEGSEYSNEVDMKVLASPPAEKTLTSLTVSPDTMSFTAIGQQKDIQEIILGWSDNTTSSLAEGNATYGSYNSLVVKKVTAIPNIKFESVDEGDTQIKVSYTDSNNVTQSDYIAVSVEIVPAELQYIEAYPKNMAFDLNDTNICDDVTQVVAWYSDGSWENIDINSVSYLSNNPGVATVNSSGTVCRVSEGNTTIQVTYQGEPDTISVSVTDTGISPPSVTTLDPIYNGGDYIAMKGKIQSTGGENAYEIGFEYQDLAGGSVETINAYGNYEDGRAWNMTLVKGSDITYGHSYKYRAYAVNSAGTGYGTWDTFTVD